MRWGWWTLSPSFSVSAISLMIASTNVIGERSDGRMMRASSLNVVALCAGCVLGLSSMPWRLRFLSRGSDF